MAFRSEEKFAAIDRYMNNRGVIQFTLFEDFEGGVSEQRPWIIEHFQRLGVTTHSDDESFLAGNEPSRFDRNTFLGDWYDPEKGKLISVGSWTNVDGKIVNSPAIDALDQLEIKSGGFSPPRSGARGQFAYAFYQTPYRLSGTGAEIQAMFNGLWATISPLESMCEYYDWSSPDLERHFGHYYRAGAEWWGMFLFTIRDHTLRRLWVMSASTTD